MIDSDIPSDARPIRSLRLTVREFTGPCLYIWRRGLQVLYVGENAHGFERALITSKKARNAKWEQIEPTDTVEIRWRPGAIKPQLREEERRLILELRPLWNAVCACGRPACCGSCGHWRQAQQRPLVHVEAVTKDEVAS